MREALPRRSHGLPWRGTRPSASAFAVPIAGSEANSKWEAIAKAIACLAAIALFLAAAPDALAQVATATGDGFIWRDYQEPAVPPGQPLWLQAFWFLVKLGFVLGLAYGSLLLYKRMLGTRAPLGLGRIRVLENTRLAGTQSLYLVQVGEQILLLGSNGAGLLVKLSEWPADQAPPLQDQAIFTRAVNQAASRGDDFDTVIESSLKQAVIPPRDGA